VMQLHLSPYTNDSHYATVVTQAVTSLYSHSRPNCVLLDGI